MGCSEAIDALTAIAVLHTIATLVLAGVVILVLFWPRLVYMWKESRGEPHSKGDTPDGGTDYSSSTRSNRVTRKPLETEVTPVTKETTLSITPGFDVNSSEDIIRNPLAVQVEFLSVDASESPSSVRRSSVNLLAPSSSSNEVKKKSRISVASIASSLGGFSKQFVPGSRRSQDFEDLELTSELLAKDDSSSNSEGPDSPVKKDLGRNRAVVELPGSHTEESQA